MAENNCLFCGKPLKMTGKTTWKLYCSKLCQERAKAEKEKAEKERQRDILLCKTNLDRCMQEAEKQGLTYGEYMARRQRDG